MGRKEWKRNGMSGSLLCKVAFFFFETGRYLTGDAGTAGQTGLTLREFCFLLHGGAYGSHYVVPGCESLGVA